LLGAVVDRPRVHTHTQDQPVQQYSVETNEDKADKEKIIDDEGEVDVVHVEGEGDDGRRQAGEEDQDVEAVQQLLAQTAIREVKRERDIAALVELGFQAVNMMVERNYSEGRMSVNALLTALDVPEKLHFPVDHTERENVYFRIKAWLAVKRGDLSVMVYGVCSSLTYLANTDDDGRVVAEERAGLETFLHRAAEVYFRPDFVRMWRAALPRLYGQQKVGLIQALARLLNQEAKWYDQQSA
jgi:hypothetical protein